MYVEKHTLAVTVNSSGVGEGFTLPVTGRVLSARYVKDNYADGVDIAITTEDGRPILSLTDQDIAGLWHPRQPVHGPTGAGLTYDGDEPVSEPVVLAFERIKVAVSSGGNTTSGTFHFLVG